MRPSLFSSLLSAVGFSVAGLLVAPFNGNAETETVYFNGADFKSGYYLVPDEMPADGAKVWVLVDVHGAGGLKNESRGSGLAKLLAPEPVIVIVPSFTTGYQGGDGKWAEQLIDHFKAVQKNHPVHDKMFVHGHSGGGQFAHRFALNEPDYVIGVSAHSSGSWACDGGHGSISARAKGIPFTISCGENDTDFSVSGYPHTRIEWYRLFAEELEKKGFVVAGNTWPGVGHGVSSKLYGPQLKECFDLATKGIAPASGKWSGEVAEMAETARCTYGGSGAVEAGAAPAGPGGLMSDRDKGTLAQANEAIVHGRAPDVAATMRFLVQYPASRWADDDEYAELAEHCRKAAQAYLQQQEEAGKPLSGTALEKFKEATEGLGVPDGPGESRR